MDNLTQRRVIAVIGVVVAFLGLASFLWGLLKNDPAFQLLGLVLILVAYILMVVVRKLREKVQPKKKESKVE